MSNPPDHKLTALFSLFREGAVLVSAKGKILTANTAAARMLGYPENALPGMSYFEVNPHFSLMGWRKFLADLSSPVEIRTEFIDAGGELLAVSGSLSTVDDLGYAVVFSPVSPEESPSAAKTAAAPPPLRQSTTAPAAAHLLDYLNDWVILLTPNAAIDYLNQAARRKLRRRTSKPLEGQAATALLPGLELPAANPTEPEEWDYVFPDAGGGERPLRLRYFALPGTEGRAALIGHDGSAEHSAKQRLRVAKERIAELQTELERDNDLLQAHIDDLNESGPIITVSKAYRGVLTQIGQVAGTTATVLITGETGTGKELLAQSIHNFSERGHRPLVSVNCAALPDNLIESELFGHERGAFTGAFQQKKGRFELAHGGTIFLDEIGELPLDTQAKLLRTLQEGEIQRVGGTEVLTVDVRVVAATNRDLESMVGSGTFREDLFYRLNVFPIHNLPLRERPEDIPLLVRHFAQVYAARVGRPITKIPERDLEALMNYRFPGNVRELINLVERAVITAQGSTLNLGASYRALRRSERPKGLFDLEGQAMVSFEEMQRQYIIEALKRTRGKVTGPGGAAELLDVNGRTLMSRMVKLGIERAKYR